MSAVLSLYGMDYVFPSQVYLFGARRNRLLIRRLGKTPGENEIALASGIIFETVPEKTII